ncbi:MAG TPA: S1 RNA-binding domain-containing protein [Gemmata sp.]|nr:S1 RNA-binding domain-containing protein [Gemmata sp.]
MSTEPNPPIPEPSASSTPGVPAPIPPAATPPAASGPSPPAPRNAGGPGQSRPPNPGARRPGGASRPFPKSDKPFPKGDKPLNPGGTPPQLGLRDFGALKPNNRELDKMIEDELSQAMAGFSVETTVAQAETGQKQAAGKTPGQRRKGRVIGIHGKDVFIEVPGGRSQGVLPLQQFEGRTPTVGEEVEFDIERYDAGDGLLVLTREGSAQSVTDWSSIALHMIVEARITGTNKNKTGLAIEVNGIKGFMPASQLDLYRVEDLDQFINQRLKVEVIEVNPEERNLIVSRRAVLERERAQKAEQFWADIQEGQTRKGIIKSIKPFGAFVDLGGADGLIPVSEFSWQRVNDLNEFVKLGQEVQVMVARLDREARKIGLSVKQLTTSPWDEFATRVRVGARLNGKVTRTTDFGAFVELEPGIEGLIHISELSTQRIRRVRDIVGEGQTVEIEILSVDPSARRIGLSLKSIAKEKEAATDAAEEAERLADIKAAEEVMASRPVNPNLRGGIGSNSIKLDTES